MAFAGHLCSLLVLSPCAFLATAWGPEGHRRILEVPDKLLKGMKKAHINVVLKGQLLEFADWEQRMTQTHPETDVLHWHHQEPEWNCSSMLGDKGHIRCDGHGATAGSLFCGMAWFFEHFAHDAMLQDFPKPKEAPNTPKELDVLKKLKGIELTPAHYLRWLIALIGDMHQPLHMLRQYNYGRDIKVEYEGQVHTMLSFWEDFIPKRLPPLPDEKVLQKQLHKGMERFFLKTPIEHFRTWAREAATSVCTQVYGKLGVLNATSLDTPFKLSEKQYQEWLKLAGDFTRVAGLRTMETLLDIVKHERHKVAHKHGQAKYHKNSLRFPWGFCKNFCVAVVLVPFLLLAFHCHQKHGVRLGNSHSAHQKE